MKNILALAASLFFYTTSLFAQGTIEGKVIDSSTKKGLSFATVTVFKAADTSLITYRISSPEGVFKVPNIPLNVESRVIISFSGYEVYRKVFTLTSAEPLQFGDIAMAPASESLEEVMVLAERPPVTVRQDTIEFNAASFKTLPTALVEDMLKKLPGVQVDGEGNITANGKKVNRILVDGKDFFGNDPKMATRNLPANVIDKIQLTEDKDERELNPDRSAGDIGQVINLKLKKAIKKGWFGKAYAGAGTRDRFEGGAILNLFRDTMQVSLLGFSNNLNRAGFGISDVQTLGGFGRTGISTMMMNSNGGFALNGISFGGLGAGISTSTGGGFNMNHVLKNGFTLNSQYFYGASANKIAELNNRQQFLGDTVFTSRAQKNETAKTYNHTVGLGIKGKLDSLTRLEFKPLLSFSNKLNKRLTNLTNQNNIDGLLNTGLNMDDIDGADVGYNHNLLLFKNFLKKGRTFNLTNSVNYGVLNNDQVNNADNIFYDGASSYETEISQLRKRNQHNFTANLNAAYNEPLTKQLSLRFGYTGTYYDNDDKLGTFNKDGGGKFVVPNSALTNNLNRRSWRNNASAGLNWKHKELSITAVANMQFLNIWNNFDDKESVNKKYKYVLPGLTINRKAFNFSYSAAVEPPNINDLQPTPDNTNPLYIIEGNPNLDPTLSHSANLNFFKNIPEKTMFINAYLNGNIRKNAITRSRQVLPNGVQISTPVNVNGVHNLYNNFGINKQYKFNKNFQVSFGGGYNLNYNRNFLIVNKLKSYVTTTTLGPSANGSFNWKDIVEWNFRYTVGFNKTTYESNTFNDLKTNRQSANTELVVRWPKHLVWETSFNYSKNALTAPGVQPQIGLWNAGLTIVFLKDDKGQLKFAAYDLLNESVSVNRFTTENAIVDTQVEVLQRYFMATFTYNIRSFKGGKVGGRDRGLFMF